ncbi:MAG: hypothetical protein MZU95_08570 [Desulfomicrobium escambiense]|nr:hypothetical protein [Desulfomicrobium escambiense]
MPSRLPILSGRSSSCSRTAATAAIVAVVLVFVAGSAASSRGSSASEAHAGRGALSVPASRVLPAAATLDRSQVSPAASPDVGPGRVRWSALRTGLPGPRSLPFAFARPTRVTSAIPVRGRRRSAFPVVYPGLSSGLPRPHRRHRGVRPWRSPPDLRSASLVFGNDSAGMARSECLWAAGRGMVAVSPNKSLEGFVASLCRIHRGWLSCARSLYPATLHGSPWDARLHRASWSVPR